MTAQHQISFPILLSVGTKEKRLSFDKRPLRGGEFAVQSYAYTLCATKAQAVIAVQAVTNHAGQAKKSVCPEEIVFK